MSASAFSQRGARSRVIRTGRVRTSVNVPVRDIAVAAEVSRRVGLPVFADNDAACAALAELYGDEDAGVRALVMLTSARAWEAGSCSTASFTVAPRAAPPKSATCSSPSSATAGPAKPAASRAPARSRPGPPGDHWTASLRPPPPTTRLGRRAVVQGTATASDVVQAARDGDDHAASILRLIGELLGEEVAGLRYAAADHHDRD